jgi:ATP-dependent helicase HrpB
VTAPATGLPVEAIIDDLRAALATAGVAVLVAPPGSGKTTVVPLRLLDALWLAGRKIVVLEPRRLATRAAARRMAALLGQPVGDTVGFATRDERVISPTTRIEVVTEGVLTRRLQQDRRLPGVGLIVFDEVHERNLPTDLGLALALDTRAGGRPDLALLAMSATVDAGRLAKLLGRGGDPAPVVASEAEQHPVALRWLPRRPDERLEPSAAAAVRRALVEQEGDVLAFLPGAGEIRRVAELLTDEVSGPGRMALAEVDVLPLYGMLSAAEQDAALRPSRPGRRRVVLATDIAESSLTVEGVRVVVDSGLARMPRFDPRTSTTRLQARSVSRASADQRAGRAGRLGPGVAYRLWSKLEDAARPREREPEITQVDLAGLALELALWGAEPGDLAWLDPPPARAWKEARSLLAELGALDADGELTTTGRAMGLLPVHPRLAHLVVAGDAVGHGYLACILAVLVDERDVLRGRLDELPVDLGVRVALVADDGARHRSADLRALAGARQRALDLARRAGVAVTEPDLSAVGRTLALAYPDRWAARKGSLGRFQVRGGAKAWLPASDALAAADFLVVADLDGRKSEARIRLGAALSAGDALAAYDRDVVEQRTVTWDREREQRMERVTWRLGGVVLDEVAWPIDPQTGSPT